jgi:hypothetical protein
MFKDAEQEALQILSERFNMRSYKNAYRSAFWNEKKRILKEKYDIDWKTLAELNPERFGI